LLEISSPEVITLHEEKVVAPLISELLDVLILIETDVFKGLELVYVKVPHKLCSSVSKIEDVNEPAEGTCGSSEAYELNESLSDL
jgi:hypothetical protein